MKRLSVRIIAVVLLFAMLLATLGQLTAFASETIGDLIITVKDGDTIVEDLEGLKVYHGSDIMTPPYDLNSIYPNDLNFELENDDYNLITTEMIIPTYVEGSTETPRWEKDEDGKFSVSIVVQVEKKEVLGALEISFKDGEEVVLASDIPGLTIKIGDQEFTEAEVNDLKKDYIEIDEILDLVITLGEGNDYKFENDSVSKTLSIPKDEWSDTNTLDKVFQINKVKEEEPEIENKADRVYGNDRFLTSVEISKRMFPVSSDVKPKTVIIASGANTADALSAGPLAIKAEAPILLVTKASIPADVLTEIKRLDPENIIIVGGVNTVGTEVETALKTIDKDLVRISGEDRFETSIEVAKKLKADYKLEGLVLANGFNEVDALAVSGYAAKHELGIVLTAKDALPTSVITYVDANVNYVDIVGGPNSVAKAVETELGSKFNSRVQGANRYETAVNLADKTYKDVKSVIFVNGNTPVDALAAAPLAQKEGKPILLVLKNAIQADTLKYVKDNKVEDVLVIGGPNSVDKKIMDDFIALNPPKTDDATE